VITLTLKSGVLRPWIDRNNVQIGEPLAQWGYEVFGCDRLPIIILPIIIDHHRSSASGATTVVREQWARCGIVPRKPNQACSAHKFLDNALVLWFDVCIAFLIAELLAAS